MPTAPPSSPGNVNAVLFHLCRLTGTTDVELADVLGITRQSAHARRARNATIPANDLPTIADLLDVPVDLFFGLPVDAVSWVVKNRPELFEVAA